MNEFSLKYLAKFIFESFHASVESLSVNGGPMPLLAVKHNSLVQLQLRDQNLYSEDLFVLAQFLKHNSSVTHINLSKNFVGYRHIEEAQVIEMKMKNQEKLKDFSFEQLFYDSLGLEHLTIALENTERLKHLDLSENDLGASNFKLLLRLFPKNTQIEVLNVADCKLDVHGAVELCKILERTNKNSLRNLYFRNSRIGDEGAAGIAKLIKGNTSIVELEIFNCGVSERGGAAIGEALKTNFCIEKLSIGENILNKKDVE
jgi:Ran GTPase-activating protein (RanGAP) involved in mRNA processing and transport